MFRASEWHFANDQNEKVVFFKMDHSKENILRSSIPKSGCENHWKDFLIIGWVFANKVGWKKSTALESDTG